MQIHSVVFALSRQINKKKACENNKSSNSADKFCIFEKPVIYTNLITCSAKLSLHAAEPGQSFCNTGVYSLIPSYISMKSVKFSKVSSNNINEVKLK